MIARVDDLHEYERELLSDWMKDSLYTHEKLDKRVQNMNGKEKEKLLDTISSEYDLMRGSKLCVTSRSFQT